ncbi:MAG: hypothetical protein ACW967_07000 [Candidatus Hodarchaeales archaeon]|jgi:chromosome segregation ATPase
MNSADFSEMDQIIFAKVYEAEKSYEASQKIVSEKYSKIDSYLNTIDTFQKELRQLEVAMESTTKDKKSQIQYEVANLQQKISDYFSLVNTLKIEAATLSSAVETSKENYDNSINELDQIIKILENKLKQFEDQFSGAIEILNQITIERGKQTHLLQNLHNKFKLVGNNIDKSKSSINSIIHSNTEDKELQLIIEDIGEVQKLSEKLLEKYSQAIGQLEEVNDTIDINSNKLIEIEKQKKAKYASIYEFKQMRGIEGEREFF